MASFMVDNPIKIPPSHAYLIAIEGLDGSGKQTQAQLLAVALASRGLSVQSLSFPSYGQPSAAPAEEYLAGYYGHDPNAIGAYGAALFFTVDRFASYLKTWKELYRTCDVLVCDRYVASNVIHQCSKLPRNEWEPFATWLGDLEFNKLALPKPNLTIYLRVGVKRSQAQLTNRYDGMEDKKDIHEADMGYMQKSYSVADWCATRFGWKIIECETNGVMRSIAEIHTDIMGCLPYI